MARERIDDLTEARRLRHDYREQDVAYLVPDVGPVAGGPHGVSGVGMDGIEVDFEALRQAERDLATLHEDLLSHMAEATELTGPLGDGSSPVTGPMRAAFHTRAGDDGGVRTALRQYMAEVIGVRVAILRTLASYEGVEHDAVSRLRRQLGELA